MPTKKTDNPNEIFIHIKAESEVMGVNCIVPETRAVKFLEQLRNNFIKLKSKYRKYDDVLKVKTCVHNPKML